MTCLCKPSKYPFLEFHQPKVLYFIVFLVFLVFLGHKIAYLSHQKFPFLEIPYQNGSHDLLMSAIKIAFFGNPYATVGHMIWLCKPSKFPI
jgi:hypothetical protein